MINAAKESYEAAADEALSAAQSALSEVFGGFDFGF